MEWVCAAKCCLDVADDGAKPDKLLYSRRSLAAAGDIGIMNARGLRDRAEAGQAVAVDRRSRRDVPPVPALDRRPPEAGRRLELDLVRKPLPGCFQSCDERRLSVRAPASLSFAHAAEIDIVHLYQPLQRLFVLALHHRLCDIVFHALGNIVGSADLAHGIHRRDELLAPGDQKNGLKPGRERQLGVLEELYGGDRGLANALRALPQVPPLEPAVSGASAGRAFESPEPALVRQGFGAFFLGAVVPLEH